MKQHIDREHVYTSMVLRAMKCQKTATALQNVYHVATPDVSDDEDEALLAQVQGNFEYFHDVPGHGDTFEPIVRRCMKTDREEVLLDERLIRSLCGGALGELGVFKVSSCERYIAFTLDDSGDECWTLFTKDLELNCIVGKPIPAVGSIVWSTCQDPSFCYTACHNPGHPLQPNRVYKRCLTSVLDDKLLFEETNENFMVDVTRTKDKVGTLRWRWDYKLIFLVHVAYLRYCLLCYPRNTSSLHRAQNARQRRMSRTPLCVTHFVLYVNGKTMYNTLWNMSM